MRRGLLYLLVVLIGVANLVPTMALAQSLFGFGQQQPQQYTYYQRRQLQQQQYYQQQQQQQQQSGQQQPPRRRTLLDMLFGPSQQELDQQQQLQQQPKPKPQPPQLPPAKPTIAKADGATRVAVFGDSLAGDVGKALDRFYADDPGIAIIQQAVGSSGFARPDYFDWDKTIGQQIAANSFDVAVMIVGVNDRQNITLDGKSLKPLTDEWNTAYSQRLANFVSQLRAANKPLIWIGLPPMAAPQLSTTMSQISSLERLASFGNGAQFVDIYDKFLDEDGNYEQSGPDVNGQQALMRKSDGIHFANAGADKVAFYADQQIRLFAHGGAGASVTDPLAGSDAAAMLRPPYQGLGQAKLLQLAGAVIPLTGTQPRAEDLVSAGSAAVASGFDMKQLVEAPVGRADAFGVGVDPEAAPPPAAAPAVPSAVAAPTVVPVVTPAAAVVAVPKPAAVQPTVASSK